jgi:hypothetical protein
MNKKEEPKRVLSLVTFSTKQVHLSLQLDYW